MTKTLKKSSKIDYLGWSGFHIYNDEEPHIYIDPPKGTRFPSGELIILLTHGHPEHLGGTYDLVKTEPINQKITIIASGTVCKFLKKSLLNNNIGFIKVRPLETHRLSKSTEIISFRWSHMPLLPPGIKAASQHIWHLLKGGIHALNIMKMSLKGPNGAGTMLGYIIKINDQNIIVYGEGLHRQCKVEDVSKVGAIAPSATILVAAEPEDIKELPLLVHASGALKAIIYEPHRPWRDQFQLPHIDLETLMKKISYLGIKVRIVE